MRWSALARLDAPAAFIPNLNVLPPSTMYLKSAIRDLKWVDLAVRQPASKAVPCQVWLVLDDSTHRAYRLHYFTEAHAMEPCIRLDRFDHQSAVPHNTWPTNPFK